MCRREILDKNWPNMNEEVADKKVLMYINKAQVMDVGTYLDKVRCSGLMMQNNLKHLLFVMTDGLLP